jgi:Protein of unknown function (DUF2752)
MNHNPEPNGFPVGRWGRVLLIVWSLAELAGFGVAYRLEPDPRGFGTHQRLGLPPCTIRAVFGIPCPSCGMTTSFANITKGHWKQAARANFAGLLLSIICAALVPWCWLSAFYGRLCWVRRPAHFAAFILVGVSGLATIEWMVRLFLLSSIPPAA